MLFKTSRLIFFGLSFLCLPLLASAQAEEVPQATTPEAAAETKTFIVADINVGDVQSSEADGVVTGSFTLLGNMGLQNRIAVGLVVTDSEGNLLDTQTIESNLSIRMGEVKTIPFTYRWPEYLGGAVTLSVRAETTGGLPLGMQKIVGKKFSAVSGNPIRCTVGDKVENFTCVTQKTREVTIEYFAGSIFSAPVRSAEKISLVSTDNFVPKINLPSGRYTVKMKDTDTDQTLFFQIRVPGEYGKIRNVVVYRNENQRIARITMSILASPIKGVAVVVELRDASGWSCGTATAQNEGLVGEVSIATTCSAGTIAVSLRNAAGQELDRIEESFNVLGSEVIDPGKNPSTDEIENERAAAVSFLKPGIFIAVGVMLLIVIGLFVYRRRQTHVGIFLFSIALGVSMFGSVPTASALTLSMTRMGGSEVAWMCDATTALDKATYVPGEPATLSSTLSLSSDVDARGIGRCNVNYYSNPPNTTAAFDDEAVGSSVVIASIVGDGFTSGSRSFSMPYYLAVGAPHSVKRIQANVTGLCWGGCSGPSSVAGSIPFSVASCPGGQNFATEITCDRSSDWGATWDGGPTAYCTTPADCSTKSNQLYATFCTGLWSPPTPKFPCFCSLGTSGACVNIPPPVPSACRTNIVVQSNDVCSTACLSNTDIYRVQNPAPGVYNEAWWNTSGAIGCSGTCAGYPLQGHALPEISTLPFCAGPPAPICVLGAQTWVGLTVPNFWFGGVGTPESTHVKDSLCPAGQAMTGIREYQWTSAVDEEYAEAQCAAGVSGLGAAIRVEAPNAYAYENPGTKTALCGAGEVAVGVRMYGIYAGVDEEHVDVYCAPLPSATFNTGASHWINGDGSTKFGSFKTNFCPGGEVITGVRWFQWPSNLDEEHTDIQCTPISLACGATASIVVTPGAIVGVETPSLWQRVWNYILGRESIAHASGSANIIVNQQGLVTWSSSGVSDCTITSAPGLTGFPITLTTAGSYTIPPGTTAPGQSYTFTMNCTGATGGASDTAALNVAAATDFKVCPASATIG
ncbi:MAG: hypothetical protein ACEQSB_05540, partial [Undibacterium sp.]